MYQKRNQKQLKQLKQIKNTFFQMQNKKRSNILKQTKTNFKHRTQQSILKNQIPKSKYLKQQIRIFLLVFSKKKHLSKYFVKSKSQKNIIKLGVFHTFSGCEGSTI